MKIFTRIITNLRSLNRLALVISLTIISLICMQDSIYTILIWVTLGLAFALVIIPNICAIVWAKIGADYFFPNIGNASQWGIAGIIIAVISIGPAFLAKMSADRVISQYIQNDVVGDVPQSPAHIKIFYDGRYGNASCDYICQDLFLTDTVKILTYESSPFSPYDGTRLKGSKASYKLSEGAACRTKKGKKLASLKKPERPALLDLITQGYCIVKSKPSAEQADIIIAQTIMNKNDLAVTNKTAPLFVNYTQVGKRSITDRQGKVLISQGDITLDRPFLPSFFGYGGSGNTIRLAVMKTQDKSINDSLALWGMKKIYPNIPVQEEHRNLRARPKTVPKNQIIDDAIMRANKVLDEAPLNEDINNSQVKILSLALREKNSEPNRRVNESVSDPVITLALKILADQRVQDIGTLDSAVFFLKRRTVPYDGDLNAVILKRLQKAKKSKQAVTFQLLKHLSKDVRKTNGAMIMKELNQQIPENIKESYWYAGHLGVSPVNLFNKAINEHQEWTTLLPVAKAIRCGDPRWRAALVPSLDKMIAQHARGEGSRLAAGVSVQTLNKEWKMPTSLSQKHRSFNAPTSTCR